MTPIEKARKLLPIFTEELKNHPRPYADTVLRIADAPDDMGGWVQYVIESPKFHPEDTFYAPMFPTLVQTMVDNISHLYRERYQMLAMGVVSDPESAPRLELGDFKPLLTEWDELFRFGADGKKIPRYVRNEKGFVIVNPKFDTAPYRDEIHVVPGWLTEHVYAVRYPHTSTDSNGVTWTKVADPELNTDLDLEAERGTWSAQEKDGSSFFRGFFCYKHIVDHAKIARVRVPNRG
jgi:hypothetical protein